MNNVPFFSIIMPVYNMETFLDKSINSLINQSFSDWELVAVDDGSTDNTFEILKKYAEIDKRIKVIHQENSGCAGAARNTALQIITGKYMQMLDADDYFSLDLLMSLKDKIDKTNADIVLPIAKSINEKHNILYEWLPPNKNFDLILSGPEAFKLSLDWTIHGWMCVRSSILKQIGYETKLMNGDEFTTRKLFHNSHCVAFAKGIYYYFNNITSTTRNTTPRIQSYQPLNTLYNLYVYSKNYPELSDCVPLIATNFLGALFFYEKKYIVELNQLKSLRINVEINNFIKKMFLKKNIKLLKLINRRKLKLFYMFTFNSFTLFKIYCKLILLLKKE